MKTKQSGQGLRMRGRQSMDSGYSSPLCPALPPLSPHHLDVSLQLCHQHKHHIFSIQSHTLIALECVAVQHPSVMVFFTINNWLLNFPDFSSRLVFVAPDHHSHILVTIAIYGDIYVPLCLLISWVLPLALLSLPSFCAGSRFCQFSPSF